MIKKFFRNLNKNDISYILISGQATVIYGASTFSEDIDLWVEAKADNWNKFIKLLNGIDAQIYKLTPPLAMKLIRKGHGYHFLLPSGHTRTPLWFLDVMGVVPRAGDFKDCFKNVEYHETEWGKLPVIGIRDLVEIKKTRRLEDYPIISNLVKIEYERLSSKGLRTEDWKWILKNSFEAEDILYFLQSDNLSRLACRKIKRPCLVFCEKAIDNPDKRDRYVELASNEIALEIEVYRKQDRVYWKPVINELKKMNEKNQLLFKGSKPPDSIR